MEWISVKDRLPEREQHDYVLVCCTMNVTNTINYENAVTMAYVCEEGFMDVELTRLLPGASPTGCHCRNHQLEPTKEANP